ncbi:MAG: hypothetical protein EXQ90_04235 [Rhodospirillales bacterium]|nr:hypothetical protein [Rhodospirillales bacterium]
MTMRRILRIIGVNLLRLVLVVAIPEAGLRVIHPEWDEYSSARFMERATLAGYPPFAIGRPGFDDYFSQNNGDFRVRISINDFGLRNAEPVEAADGRLWVVGDSMSFGWGVARDEIFTEVIGRNAGVPTYNVASPGASVCGYQALLARMPAAVKPRAVIVGLVIENDILDYRCHEAAGLAQSASPPPSLSIIGAAKRFLTDHSALYNYTAVVLKRYAVVNDVLVALGMVEREHAYHESFDPQETAAHIRSTADALAELRARFAPNVHFAVLIAPARFEIRDGASFHAGLRRATTEALTARGIDVIDPFPDLVAAGFGPTHFAHDGHWSPLGHRIAAQAATGWVMTHIARK